MNTQNIYFSVPDIDLTRATPVQQRCLSSSYILLIVHKNNIYKNARNVMYMENICLSAIFLVPNDLFFLYLTFFHF